MIHDELVRHFRTQPQPSLSADFAANLRRRLQFTRRPRPLDAALGRWVPRLYWLGAAALGAAYWQPVSLTTFQVALVAAAVVVVGQTLRRALRAGPLGRVLHDALWR